MHNYLTQSARQRLHSSSSSTLVVPPTRLSTASDLAFPVAAARTWNSLSRSLTSVTSLASFRHQLKTELFVRSFPALDSSAYNRIWQILCYHFASHSRFGTVFSVVRCPCSLLDITPPKSFLSIIIISVEIQSKIKLDIMLLVKTETEPKLNYSIRN